MQKKIQGMIVKDARFMADMDKQMQKEVARTAKEDKKLEDYKIMKSLEELFESAKISAKITGIGALFDIYFTDQEMSGMFLPINSPARRPVQAPPPRNST